VNSIFNLLIKLPKHPVTSKWFKFTTVTRVFHIRIFSKNMSVDMDSEEEVAMALDEEPSNHLDPARMVQVRLSPSVVQTVLQQAIGKTEKALTDQSSKPVPMSQITNLAADLQGNAKNLVAP
jgi:hypothetical protein